jgi:LysM repeat protein
MKERLHKLPRHWISLVILIVSLMPASYVLARTDVPAPTFQSPPAGILGYHTVQPGETLYCIARAYGVDPTAIASTNGIVSPNLIFPGTVLAIPNVPKTLPAGRTCPRQFGGGTPPSGCRYTHVVQSGENLYRISLQYGVSMYAIAQANNILNLNLIYAGQTLCIP